MAQKGTESEKVMDQVMGTVSEGGVKPVGMTPGTESDHETFQSSVNEKSAGMKSGSGSGVGSDHGASQSSVNSSVTGGQAAGQVGGTPVSVGVGAAENIGSDDGDPWDADELDGGELSDMENTGVLVYREKFISKERRQKYWGYFVTGLLRGRKVRVSLVSTDPGGYDLLDIVFNGADSVELWRKSYTLKDEKGNTTSTGFTYSVVSLDEDGTVYTAQVKAIPHHPLAAHSLA